MQPVVDRFLHYVTFDTQSSPMSEDSPSTSSQLVFADELVKELQNLGMKDIFRSETGTVYAHIEGNRNVPAIGFIAHMDTSPDAPSSNIQPRMVHYQGGDIALGHSGVELSPTSFPILSHKVGEHLIVTDGTTLLGADDKAGIAEIMTMLDILHQDPSLPHGPLYVAFTPDEEVGRGVDHFELQRFPVAFAFTVDGGQIHDVEWENFNAASAVISIRGLGIHPGGAKGKMVNALMLAMEFDQLLPINERPEFTSGYEGFHHLHSLQGDVEFATMEYLLRHHDENEFRRMKMQMTRAATYLNELHHGSWITVHITDSYSNMRNIMEHHRDIIDLAYRAIQSIGLTPSSMPIRGGTDGAMLTAKGLPCPNLGTGGYNAHSRYEFVSVEEMEQAVKLLLTISSLHATPKEENHEN
ncbi:MAG: peptidase T [Bacilli bacterium]|jgi:tripeptide aminopeptidase